MRAAAGTGLAAFLRAAPNAPREPVDVELLALAKRWFAVAVSEDPAEDGRAHAAVRLAQIGGYEAPARQKVLGD